MGALAGNLCWPVTSRFTGLGLCRTSRTVLLLFFLLLSV